MKRAQVNNNNVFLFSVVVFSVVIIFFAGFLNFNPITVEDGLFTTFSFKNIVSATGYVWFDTIIIGPIFVMLGIIVYDKIRGIN